MLYSETQQNRHFSGGESADFSNDLSGKKAKSDGYLLPSAEYRPERVHLTDTTTRRLPGNGEEVLWDDALPGFGLRIRPSGTRTWIVQLRHRSEQRKVSLGATDELRAAEARARARAMLRDAALHGLPVRRADPRALRFSDYVEEFWRDYAPHWKPTTQRRARYALDGVLIPYFGRKPLPGISRADVLTFRGTRAHRGSSFHTELAVLSAMLGYAEKLGYRLPGSNPCRGVPRYKQRLRERYLTTREYQRLGGVLRERAGEMARSVAIVRLLLFTGARKAEIEGLRWEWLTPSCARLPDSKTGPKRLYLNRPANAVLDRIGRADTGFILGDPLAPSRLAREWEVIRRAAAIPDVRLHDLRHSFASLAITSGMPLLTLGRLLGHALPETTSRYAHLADEAIQDAASRISGSIAKVMGMRS